MPPPTPNAPLRHAGILAVGQRIELGLLHVRGLRFREINPKEAFTLMDEGGSFFRASLIALGDAAGEALVYEAMTASPESPAHITLLCAVLARQRMLGVIQKATELGVAQVVPVLSDRSVQRPGLAHEKAHAWPRQALRASRQCRRASVPEIRSAIPFADALDDPSFRGADRRIYLDDCAGVDMAPTGAEKGAGRLAFAVGPEGGWSDQERKLLQDRGAEVLRFGGRVLRAETAVLVGLALLQHWYGDL
jgi:16S rRNA (uracil1498-N3)-methyltransferase